MLRAQNLSADVSRQENTNMCHCRIFIIFFIGLLVTVTFAECQIYSEITNGLEATIVADNNQLRINENVKLTFYVRNNSQESIEVPVPDPGTLSFNTVTDSANAHDYGTGGHTALAANYSRLDRWTILDSGKTLSYSFSYKWNKPGIYKVYFLFYSRFKDKPFPTLRTPNLKITVKSSND